METQQSINEWQLQTFGPVTDRYRLYHKFEQEVFELHDECILGTNTKAILEECADVYIMLVNLVKQYDGDLQDEVNKKMQINRQRTWKLNGDGTGKHALS